MELKDTKKATTTTNDPNHEVGYWLEPKIPNPEPIRFFAPNLSGHAWTKNVDGVEALHLALTTKKIYYMAYRLTQNIGDKELFEVWHKTPIEVTGKHLCEFIYGVAIFAFNYWKLTKEGFGDDTARIEGICWKEV
jgi:hypothetical protein